MDSVAAALHTIRIERLVANSLGWSALVAPLLAVVIAWRARVQLAQPQRGTRIATAILVAAAYSLAALAFGGCFIGDTGKRQLGRAIAMPVLGALANYHSTAGTYPDSLEQLVPTYLPLAASRPPAARLLNGPLVYVRDSAGFTLSFSYIGPGANTCTISPTHDWRCGGIY